MAFNSKLFDGMLVFSEVAATGSFTKAAAATGHSTSYISKEINKLEERLGVRLLNRSTRSVSLTPEGESYYPLCQQIIAEAQQAEALVNHLQPEPQGKIRISCPSSFGLSHLRPVFTQFLKRYPKVSLDLDFSGRQVDVIAEGIDVAIRATTELNDSSLICRKLLSSYGATVASPAYLKACGTPTKPEQLKQHKTITYSHIKMPDQWQYEDKQGKVINVQLQSVVHTNSPHMELEFALEGVGITRLPEFFLGDRLHSGELIELFKEYKKPSIDVYLVYASRKHMSAKVRCFIDFMLEAVNT
ncbi:LysR family transcriptional regulator [Agaribacterium haliotis]|uniref:LysR family transcriptional regulator n=1 Tax=Agaribacterium haliotis TaxID=2013869 RepID=UPI000BB58698|nr:LysR family transcriptional regulator [Agaribacterium haliotis]